MNVGVAEGSALPGAGSGVTAKSRLASYSGRCRRVVRAAVALRGGLFCAEALPGAALRAEALGTVLEAWVAELRGFLPPVRPFLVAMRKNVAPAASGE